MTKARASKLKKIATWSFPALASLLAVLITVTVGWRPVLGAKSRVLTDRHFEPTPERLARGKYLVEGVLGCLDCHSQRAEPPAGLVPGFSNGGGGPLLAIEVALSSR